jgi:energy-coupling factor transporter ATP-binding protein EcfA2
MKLISFKAKKIHDYMDFNINFFDDLNFLAGLNGSGKTTVLNVIINLITPSFKNLIDMNYESIELKFIHKKNPKEKDKIYFIKSEKINNDFYFSFNEKAIRINLTGIRIQDEDDIRYEIQSDEVIKELEEIPTPMFLDLKRRFIDNSRNVNNRQNEIYRRSNKRIFYEDIIDEFNTDYNDLSLDELKNHITNLVNSITRKELRLSEKLKKDILRASLTIQELITKDDLNIPSLEKISEYKKNILSTFDLLGLKDKDDKLFDDFFDSIEKILKDLIQLASKNRNNISEFDLKKENIIISKWIINQPQLYRINKLSMLISNHQNNIKKLTVIKDKFLNAVNIFYKQTEKELKISNNGEAEIIIKGKNRKIDYLSSGERQILILFSHLYLNKNLPKSGVFIIDEPELSLHLLWQQSFVDAIIQAKPDLQIILATHSPAIIQNKKNKYVPLNNANE